MQDSFVEFYLKKFTKKGDKTLDIGCGAGHYRNSTNGVYVGMDITDEPYKPGLPRNVDVVAYAEKMPFSDNEFDLVFSKSAFYQFKDHAKSMNEIKRVLKPGGRLILFDYNRRTQKRLEGEYGTKLPCWTIYQLKKFVAGFGFEQLEYLFPLERELSFWGYLPRIILTEFYEIWAIVTGINRK